MFIAPDREPGENERREHFCKFCVAAQLLLDELKIPFLIVPVSRSRPFSTVVVNQLSVSKNNKLIEEASQGVRVSGAPWAARR